MSLLSSRSALYSKPYDSRNAPWWKKSSPIHVSVIGAWGEIALTAGCGLMPAMVARKPGYDTPSAPTRPLLSGTFLSSHSTVS